MSKKKEKIVSLVKKNNQLFVEANGAWDRGDLRKAFTIFMASAKLGDVGSQIDLGYFFDNGLFVKQDKKKALGWYRKAYLQGDTSGANNIATVYRDLGDTKKMMWWFRRAAAMGDIDVNLDLGERYEKGLVVSKNPAKARLFYQRVITSKQAAKDDKTKAQARLLILRCKRRSQSRKTEMPAKIRVIRG